MKANGDTNGLDKNRNERQKLLLLLELSRRALSESQGLRANCRDLLARRRELITRLEDVLRKVA
jgi:hypothetical protein